MAEGPSLLCTGDLHLGRHPTRIPESLDGADFSPRAIWQSTVRSAVEHEVDAVVVTGDVVDRENRYFEAFGAFEEGATMLDEAGIPTVVVAGNHDFDVLPILVESLDLDSFHLLGKGGDWEGLTLEDEGEALVQFDGWSFPSEHVLESPLTTYEPRADASAPVVGVVHGDVETPESEYAPISDSELHRAPVDAWLLGHIHRPAVHRESDPLVMYPGSPQPLDPGEPGRHGPWLLAWDGDRFEPTQLPLATVRYDRLEVDVSQADDPKAIPPLVREEVSDLVQSEPDTDSLDLLLARVRLTGRTDVHADLVNDRASMEDQLAFKEDRVRIRIESVEVETQPAVDLEALSQGNSPVAHLADLLLDLEDGGVDAHPDLLEAAGEAMHEAYQSGAFDSLRREGWSDPPEERETVAVLRNQARLLLDELLDQKEAELA